MQSDSFQFFTSKYIYIYIYIYIYAHIIMMSRCKNGFPRLLEFIRIAVVEKFFLVGQHWHLLQQCPAYFVRLIWMILKMEGRWLYISFFVRCCFQDLFNIAGRILAQFPSRFFFILTASMWCLCKVVLTKLLHGIDPLYSIAQVRLPHDRYPFDSSPRLFSEYIDITLSGRDAATQIRELAY